MIRLAGIIDKRSASSCSGKRGYCNSQSTQPLTKGCFMMLPPQEFIILQSGRDLVTCPSCQRILFYETDEAEAVAS